MEKMIEAYKTINPNAQIELQTSDSTTGVQNTINNTCDIGMASRALKDSEKSKGVKEVTIAIDLLAGIPSVVYGFFGLMVIVPIVRQVFGGNGSSILTASILLGMMILPTIINISESSLNAVPQSYYEAARALAVCPEVLLMDEPTSALDPISTSKIEDCILELKEKYTIVIVTHNMQQAVRISDKTVFFLLGEIIEEGDTQDMSSKPKMKKTEDYITGRFG